MRRRDFIKSVMAAGAITTAGGRAQAATSGWREFELTYRVSLKDAVPPARLWVPVPQDALDYQRVVDLGWRSAVPASVLWDKASRAPIVSFAWLESPGTYEAEIT